MKDQLQNIRNLIEQDKGKRSVLLDTHTKLIIENRKYFKDLRYSEEALLILQKVALETQKEIEYHINKIVSLGLECVFPDPYKFELEFVTQRNKTEANLWLVKRNSRYHPTRATGGGVADIVSFALRVAILELSGKQINRNVLVLDEPFKHLSVDLQERANNMLALLSKELKLQIIMVSHIPEIENIAGKIFDVTINNVGETEVSERGL